MNLHTVTITGADDSINPSDIVHLSQKYPYVEWGLLLSSNVREGVCRFPSLEWLENLSKAAVPKPFLPPIKFSGHFCGNLVSNFVLGNLPTSEQIPTWLWKMIQRIQINFHGVPHHPKSEFYGKLPRAMKASGKQFIFQADNVNEDLFWGIRNYGVDAVPLFDLSHGGGVVPISWPEPFPGVMCGYAGGLGPRNLKDQIEKISSLVGDHDIWIDMETNVRSNADRQFDLEKVETCLKIAEPHVTP